MRVCVILSASLAAAFLTLTGCSADESSSGGRENGSSQERTPPLKDADAALTEAVEKYTAAYFGGDAATTFGMLSERCRGVVNDQMDHAAEGEEGEAHGHADEKGGDAHTAEHGGTAYEAAVAQAAEKYGPRRATGVKARGETAGTEDGRVLVEYEVEGVPDFGQEQPWLKERGDWKYDAC
ncbi:hypothetical protein ACFTZ8_32410 [Streptomyces fungicidicus]|uniref:hypothetical protein n=1 Tax=Streptomyces fungicidicus TaxID=68203 RepID=UPI00363DE02F